VRARRVAALAALAATLGACAANTPQQALAYERWARCNAPYVSLEGIGVDGQITFQFSNSAARDETFRCLAEAGRSGPPLPAPRGVRPPGGP
jgi:hypothetical protein